MAMKKIATGIALTTLIFGVSCDNECKLCISPHAAPTFVINYKTDSIPDLLNPKTGIYDPSKVMVYEEINTNGKVVQRLASYSVKSDYRHFYFLYYNCSLNSEITVQKTLIQLKSGVVDTLTYRSTPPYYPVEAYYNWKPVWWDAGLSSAFITITK